MAHSQDSTTSSGYSHPQGSAAAAALNPHYLCYWRDSCNGQHELNQCDFWENELNGKLGIYYSSSGDYELFTRDRISGVNLEHNRAGCRKVHLLIYDADQKKILFGLKWYKERKSDRRKHLLLAFPSAHPFKRNGNMLEIPYRAFQWLTTNIDFANQCLEQGLKNHFLFQNSKVIYPVHLTNEQASKLTRDFVANEEFQSLHWFPLSQILSQLPPWPDYLQSEATENELAQISQVHLNGIRLGEYQLRPVVAVRLMCIREHVPRGFETFLQV